MQIPHAKSDFGHRNRHPMTLPCFQACRLEANEIQFCGRSLHQPADGGRRLGHIFSQPGTILFASIRSKNPLRPIRFHGIAIQPPYPHLLDDRTHGGICVAEASAGK
jgi:hypothetical protein